MKSVATLDQNEANEVVARLKGAGIASETRTVTLEGGIEANELFVEEGSYDAACDLIDVWLDDRARKLHMVCPKCQSTKIGQVPHDSVEVLYKCFDCGREILVKA